MYSKIAIIALLASTALAIPFPHHGHRKAKNPTPAATPPGMNTTTLAAGAKVAKAVYFQTNDATMNSVVAVKVGAGGALVHFNTHATGGKGASGVDGNATAGPDALFSQGAIDVKDSMLFAVNAGDNTLSMFSIDPIDPTCMKLVGEPACTLGEFPVSVSYSSVLKQACVVNSGAKDGVVCYKVDNTTGLTALDTVPRPFGLNQTTPPVGPTNTVSHIFFAPDSSALYVTVKGNPAVNNTGFLAAYAVANNVVATEPVKTSPNGTAVLFGSFMPNPNTIIATDASFGTSFLTIDETTLSATSKINTPIAGQGATCWIASSSITGSVYVTDVAVNHVVEMSVATGAILSTTNFTNGNAGNIDNVVGGDFLYNLSPREDGAAIAVMDLSGGAGKPVEMQTFLIPKMAGKPSMGMKVVM